MANVMLSAVVNTAAIDLQAANGGAGGDGSAVNIAAGSTAAASAFGGNVNIDAGTAASSDGGYGGYVNVRAGRGGTTGDGGNVVLTAGGGGDTANGGGIDITAGAGGDTSGNGGNVTISPGTVTSGTIGHLILNNLPTADPTIAGAVWNDSGVLKISAG